MTDKPIPFSAPMIRSLLAGTKSQTRRVLKDAPHEPGWHCDRRSDGLWWVADPGVPSMPARVPWAVGDRLWVREGFALVGSSDPGFRLYRATGYEAECERNGFDKPFPAEKVVRWQSPIHMPRWASRITLLVTEVRVQRLQSISEADCFAEGVAETDFYEAAERKVNSGAPWSVERLAYADLSQSLHGEGSWDLNPWVAAITFKTILANIDAKEARAA